MPTPTDSATAARKQRDRERAAKYYREHRAAVCARIRNRYANDPEHREAVKRQHRERYAAMKRAVDTLRAQTVAGIATTNTTNPEH